MLQNLIFKPVHFLGLSFAQVIKTKKMQQPVSNVKGQFGLRSVVTFCRFRFGLLTIDNKHKVTFINRKGCQVLGYDEEDIIGKDWFNSFLPERIRENVASVFNKLLSGKLEAAERFENPILTSNGEERIIAWRNSDHRNQSIYR